MNHTAFPAIAIKPTELEKNHGRCNSCGKYGRSRNNSKSGNNPLRHNKAEQFFYSSELRQSSRTTSSQRTCKKESPNSAAGPRDTARRQSIFRPMPGIMLPNASATTPIVSKTYPRRQYYQESYCTPKQHRTGKTDNRNHDYQRNETQKNRLPIIQADHRVQVYNNDHLPQKAWMSQQDRDLPAASGE